MQEEKQKILEIFSQMGRRLAALRQLSGAPNQEAFGKAMGGFTTNQISRAERGVGGIPPELAHALAEKLGVNLSWLFTGKGRIGFDDPLRASPVLNHLQALALGIEPAAVSPYYPPVTLVERGYTEVEREDPRPPVPGTTYLPIIDRIAAGPGEGTDLAEAFGPGDADTFVLYSNIPGRKPVPPGAFALKVKGRSMSPPFEPGDLVICDPSQSAAPGRPACVVYREAGGDRAARLKLVRREGRRVFLVSLNPLFPPAQVRPADLLAAFTVIDHLPLIVRRRGP
jgi:SOS-response transcriptional repressor LexA